MSRFGLTGGIVLACGLLIGAASGGSAAAQIGASRGGALEASGAAMLNNGEAQSISCAAAGECAAGGYYMQGHRREAFVVSETNGSWGNAIRVPGTATLNSGGDADVFSISCAAAGECAAGGVYTDGSRHWQAFVVSETNGTWGNAIEVPGTAKRNSGGFAYVGTISCAAAGECAAGGSYTDGSGNGHVFVVSETNGTWGKALEVPGTATLNTGGDADVTSISCPAAGECAAGGYYTDSSHSEAFVVSETSGHWGNAIEVPGTATLNIGGDADVGSISCAAAGECAAGGGYSDGTTLDTSYQAFVVSETNGTWGDAIEVPGTATLNTGGVGWVDSISCAAAGECAASGLYTGASDEDGQAFVVNETNGAWGDAIEVPGTATLNTGGDARAYSISCAAAGECAAGGYYTDGSSQPHAYVVGETNGTWGNAIEVPGTATLNTGARAYSISCAAAGECAAGGRYHGSSHHAFVVSETNGSWGNAIHVGNFPASCLVPNVVGKPISAAKKRLNAGHCGLGKITRAYSKVKRGRVAAQRPKPGKALKAETRVAVTVSKGRRR